VVNRKIEDYGGEVVCMWVVDMRWWMKEQRTEGSRDTRIEADECPVRI
jgi:hypothetical protein